VTAVVSPLLPSFSVDRPHLARPSAIAAHQIRFHAAATMLPRATLHRTCVRSASVAAADGAAGAIHLSSARRTRVDDDMRTGRNSIASKWIGLRRHDWRRRSSEPESARQQDMRAGVHSNSSGCRSEHSGLLSRNNSRVCRSTIQQISQFGFQPCVQQH
jgi:hypothetical protein